jgi:hypothetical protein
MVRPLAQGLQTNQSLQELSLYGWEIPLLTVFFEGIVGHPTLQRLHLLGGLSFPKNNSSNHPFYSVWNRLWRRRTTNPQPQGCCCLTELRLEFYNTDTIDLLFGNTPMPSLTRLSILRSHVTTADVDRLLCTLQCPNLQVLDLSHNYNHPKHIIDSFQFTKYFEGRQQRRLSSLQQLLLPSSPKQIHEEWVWLYKLRVLHPQLEVLSLDGTSSNSILPPVLLTGSSSLDVTELPISIWSLVLEQANRLLKGHEEEQAQCLWGFLRERGLLSILCSSGRIKEG